MRSRKGYTLAELLIALGICAIVCALTIPSAVKYAQRIRMTRLNDTARVVYMASYDRIMSLYTVNKLNDLPAKVSPAAGRLYLAVSGDDLPAPFDACKSAIIEYVDTSASVAGVYLSEEMPLAELEEHYIAGEISEPEQRIALKIGYYGGMPACWPKGQLYKIQPKITVHNGEDLFLVISCDDLPDNFPELYRVTLTLSDGVFSVFEDLGEYPAVHGQVERRILLDSLQPYGERFALKYSGLIGGEITATATISCGEFSGSASATFDPLFESRDGETVNISKARHLNNLRFIKNYAAVQTADIPFNNVDGSEFFYGKPCDLSIAPLPELTGSYDGSDFMLKNVKLTDIGDDLGLFSAVSGEVSNVHIAGTTCYSAKSSELIGGICGELKSGGSVQNCSVSEVSINAPSGSYVGGIAGRSSGKIEHCSAVLGDISLGESCHAGGISGSGGEISLSHSAGKFVADSGCMICGIAPDSAALNCYSECSTGYISGSDFYGVSNIASNGSFCATETSWLALDRENLCRHDDLSIDGFFHALQLYDDTALSPDVPLTSESVTKNGVPARFGRDDLPEPRGVIGMVKAVPEGGGYSFKLLKCFDAYGNEPEIFPEMELEDVKNERYFAFWSDFAYPAGGADGYDFEYSGELGEIFHAGDFYCRELLTAGTAALRFADQKYECDIEISAKGEIFVGKIGVMIASRIFDPVYWMDHPEGDGTVTAIQYAYFDLESSKSYFVDVPRKNSNGAIIPELDSFEPDISENECSVYIFADQRFKVGEDFSYTADNPQFAGVTNEFELPGYTVCEIFRGDYFEPCNITIDLPNGEKFWIYLTYSIDAPSFAGRSG